MRFGLLALAGARVVQDASAEFIPGAVPALQPPASLQGRSAAGIRLALEDVRRGARPDGGPDVRALPDELARWMEYQRQAQVSGVNSVEVPGDFDLTNAFAQKIAEAGIDQRPQEARPDHQQQGPAGHGGGYANPGVAGAVARANERSVHNGADRAGTWSGDWWEHRAARGRSVRNIGVGNSLRIPTGGPSGTPAHDAPVLNVGDSVILPALGDQRGQIIGILNHDRVEVQLESGQRFATKIHNIEKDFEDEEVTDAFALGVVKLMAEDGVLPEEDRKRLEQDERFGPGFFEGRQ